MSQYDFGVIDPQVRDGSWLADALNQWRDALYSGHGGGAAPSYVVDGMVWRNTAGAPAMTRWYVRHAGVDRELWNISNTGVINVPAATVDWSNITAQAVFKGTAPSALFQTRAHFTGAPSISTVGSVGIGHIAPENWLHVKSTSHVAGMIETTQTGMAAIWNLKTPEGTWDWRSWNSAMECWHSSGLKVAISNIGNVSVLGKLSANGLVAASNYVATGVDLSRHLDLWSGQYGMNVTSGTLGLIQGATSAILIGTSDANVYRHFRMNGYEVTTSGNMSCNNLWANLIRGGPGDAGKLMCWATANTVVFRWTNYTLAYRIDEVVDRLIPWIRMLDRGPGPTDKWLDILGAYNSSNVETNWRIAVSATQI